MEVPNLSMLDRSLSRNLSAQVSRQLGERILSGEFLPGQLLPDEIALTEEFDVSRTVVREAVKMLVAKGIIEVRQRIGTRVLETKHWQLLDRDVLLWQQAVEIDTERLTQLMELRQTIEPVAAMCAAQRRTDADVEAISTAMEMMEANVDKTSQYVLADAHFHSAVLRAAHNQYFDALESAIFTGLLLSIRVTNPDTERNERSAPLHRAIGDAIIAGDSDAAREAMRIHLADSVHRLSHFLNESAG